MSVSDALINSVFDSRYRILRKLGSGGMAAVYLAEDEELGRRVAIKVLDARYADDDLFLERFRREAKSAAGLSHPNIVSIYDRGEADGHAYIAMEVVEGRSLKELIKSHGPLPLTKAIDYTRQILAALRFAHKNGIVHRDIKPHNILVGPEERLKVTDFGIARAEASQMTETGSILGTVHYLSPEQARRTTVSAQSDLYSVGVVLYEMLTGRVPFTGDSPIEIAMKHASDTPKPPSAHVRDIPPELDHVVLRALAKTARERYRSAEEFSDDLGRVAAGLPVSPETAEAATAILTDMPTAATRVMRGDATRQPPRRPPFPPEYAYEEPPRRRKRSVFPWLLALGLLCAAAVAGWYVWTQIQDELKAAEPVGVPLVVGLKEELALAKIEDAGLEAEVTREPSRDQPSGTVFSQKPDEGARIAKGETVTIGVSTGLPKVEVPRLAGLRFDEALQRLADLKLEAQRKEVFSDVRPPGEVVSQDPKPGEEAEEGTVVVVRVSKGQQKAGVPDVIGEELAAAQTELEAAGFEVSVVTGPSEAPEGTIFAQSPDAGVEAAKGSTVQISVSEGPLTATVPDVVGLDRGSAEAGLTGAGFSVAIQEVATADPAQNQLVQSQDPSGGVQVAPGSTVTVVVTVFVEQTPPPPAEPPPADAGENG